MKRLTTVEDRTLEIDDLQNNLLAQSIQLNNQMRELFGMINQMAANATSKPSEAEITAAEDEIEFEANRLSIQTSLVSSLRVLTRKVFELKAFNNNQQ